MSLTTAASSTTAGKLAEKTTKRNVVGAGFLLYGFGLLIVPLIKSMWLLLIPIVIFGIGHGFNVPALQTLTAGLAGGNLFGLHAVFYASAAIAITTALVGMLMPIKSRAVAGEWVEY